jgi:hypothetical protein
MVLDYTSGLCSLGVLLFTLTLYHDTIAYVKIVSPVYWIHLLILTTVAGVLVSICDSLID